MGMAVGVDYSLFYLRREREERRRGRPPREALRVTAATSGQAVLVSGLTVLIAMAGMLLAGNPVFTSIGIGTMIMISVAIVGSLTILPALLSKLGDRVDRGPHPARLAPAQRPDGESRFWGAVVSAVTRRPLVSLLAGDRGAARAGDSGARRCTRGSSATPTSPEPAGDQGLRRHPEGVPGGADTGGGDRRGRRASATRRSSRRRGARAPRPRDALLRAADQRTRRARTGRSAAIDLPLVGNGTDAASDRASKSCGGS